MKTLTALKKEKDSVEKEIARRTKKGKRIRDRIVRYRKEIARLEAALEKLSGVGTAKARRKPIKKAGRKPARKGVKKRQKRAKVGRKAAARTRKKKGLTSREMVVKVLSEVKEVTKPEKVDESKDKVVEPTSEGETKEEKPVGEAGAKAEDVVQESGAKEPENPRIPGDC